MLIEIILGERAAHPESSIIMFDTQTGTLGGNTPEGVFSESVAPLRDRFTKLKDRDNLLGAVLARLGADPGARETEAHNAVGRLLADREAVSKVADCYVGAAKKIAQGLGLSATKPDELAAQVLAMNTELTSALARAQERITELENQAAGDSAAAFHDLCLAQEENTKLKTKLEDAAREFAGRIDISEAEVERQRDAKLEAIMEKNDAISHSAELEAEIAALKVKLATADLDRLMAEATTDGMWTTLKALEHALRSRLPLP